MNRIFEEIKKLKPYFFSKADNNVISGHTYPDACGTLDLGHPDIDAAGDYRAFRNVYAQRFYNFDCATGVATELSAGGGGGGKPYATLVVAASNSTATGAASADYVCDGVADQTEINAAIAALTVGGRIILLEGTYNLTATITLASNLTIEGQGASTVLSTPGGHVGFRMMNGDGINDVRIANMKFLAHHSTATSGTEYPIYIGDTVNCNRITIEGCQFFDGRGLVLLDRVTNAWVSRCYFNKSQWDGLWVNSFCYYVAVTDCEFYDAVIYMEAYDSTVKGCILNSTTRFLYAIDAVGVRCSVVGNVINTCQYGVRILYSGNVIGNIVTDSTQQGVLAEYIGDAWSGGGGVVADNLFIRIASGVYFYQCKDLVISGNMSDGGADNSSGVGIQGTGSNRIKIVDNHIYGHDGWHGIDVSNTSEVDISGNHIENAGFVGIQLEDSGATITKDITVRNNRIVGVSQWAGESGNEPGIANYTSNGIVGLVIEGNYISDKTALYPNIMWTGIYTGSAAQSGAIVVGNYLVGVTNAPIFNANAVGTLLSYPGGAYGDNFG